MKKNHFTILITAFNSEKWIRNSLGSAMIQDYDNFDIICIDARSEDNTYAIMLEMQDQKDSSCGSITCIKNHPERCYQAENILRGVKMAKEGSIIVSLDGDDWLASEKVLKILDQVYTPDIWLTYGKYYHDDNSHIDQDAHHKYPEEVIVLNSFRKYSKQLFTHLRTWRRELFLKIREEDLKKDGRFAWNSGDCFFGYPLLEMAGKHQFFINELLYVYNVNNPLSDGKVAAEEQLELAKYAKGLPKYDNLQELWMP